MEIKKPFWKWVFCEADGTPSFARVAAAVLLGFCCGWITALVRHNHVLPEISGLTGLIGVIYGTNKLATHFGINTPGKDGS